MIELSATYSPEDNKLRLYASARLDGDTYTRIKQAGFAWAPKQDLFVAPAWTPQREDLLIELCGEIGDEDTRLVDRAEERADRFVRYGHRRASEADCARKSVASITEHIPFGQPILVGHHSERRARKDAERIDNGMRRAVNLWAVSQYWGERAARAIRHARHKERADVRARRIKRLEAEKRAQERIRDEAAEKALQKSVAYAERWITHFGHRLVYEKAMLAAQGGLPADQFELQPGGRVMVRGRWCTILRVNRREGRAISVTTGGEFAAVRPVEEIKAYEPPTAERAALVAQATTLAPTANYEREDFACITKAQYAAVPADFKGLQELPATANRGAHRVRRVSGAYLSEEQRGHGQRHHYYFVFIVDGVRKEPPPGTGTRPE